MLICVPESSSCHGMSASVRFSLRAKAPRTYADTNLSEGCTTVSVPSSQVSSNPGPVAFRDACPSTRTNDKHVVERVRIRKEGTRHKQLYPMQDYDLCMDGPDSVSKASNIIRVVRWPTTLTGPRRARCDRNPFFPIYNPSRYKAGVSLPCPLVLPVPFPPFS